MNARVITVQTQPGRQEELLNVVKDVVVPAAQHQPGFRGMLRLTDATTGKAINITLWESEDDLIASETSGYLQAMLAQVSPFFVMPPFREVFQFSLQASSERAVPDAPPRATT